MGKRGKSPVRGILNLSPKDDNPGIPITSITELRLLVGDFLSERRARGLTDSTIKYYRDKMEMFLRYCEARNVGTMAELNTAFLRAYINEMAATHSPGGNHALFRALHAYLTWYQSDVAEDTWKNPMARIKAPKKSDAKLDPADFETVKAMMKVCDRRTMLGARDYCWLIVLLDTGVRSEELLDINVEDVSLINYSINIREGKGRKQRYVYFGKRCADAIRAYLKLHPTRKGALFVVEGPSGMRLQYAGLRKRKNDLADAAGVPRPKLHGFRRLFALSMLRSGTDIMTLGRLLGHTDRYVIGRYLNVTEDDAQRAHRSGGPADHLL